MLVARRLVARPSVPLSNHLLHAPHVPGGQEDQGECHVEVEASLRPETATLLEERLEESAAGGGVLAVRGGDGGGDLGECELVAL